MSEKMQKLVDIQRGNQRMFVKLAKVAGWVFLVLGVPFLVFPPLAFGFFIVGGVLLWFAKRIGTLMEAAHEVTQEQVDQMKR
jgi:hypothetical protein